MGAGGTYCVPTAIAPRRPCSTCTRLRRRAPFTCASATSRCARPKTPSTSCGGSTASSLPRGPAPRGTRRRSRSAFCACWPRLGRCSPDTRHLLLRPNHRVPFLTAKRLRERRDVRERPIDPPPLGGVGVHRDARAEPLGPVVPAPALCVGDEVALLGRVALDQPPPRRRPVSRSFAPPPPCRPMAVGSTRREGRPSRSSAGRYWR